MYYTQLLPFIHIMAQPLERRKVEMEIILGSGGSWFEDEQDRGKKHLLEHCILSRTKSMDFQELKDYLFRENIYLNASTGTLSMTFEASGHHSDFRKIVDLLLEFAFDPSFDQLDLDREREIVLREISERRGDPNYRLYYDTQNQIFSSNSIENHEVLGDSKRVAETTINDFKELHRQNLRRSHILLCVSGGGIEIDYLTARLESYLHQTENIEIQTLLDETTKDIINFYPHSTFNDFTYLPIVHELAHDHAEITLYFPCKVNMTCRPALQIFEYLFLQYGGVLHDRLRDDLKLIYGLSSHYSRDMQQLVLNLSCEIKYIPQIVQEIEDILCDFETNFKLQKFEDFKHIMYKRQDIAQDTLGAPVNHMQNILRAYGIPENYDDYSIRLKTTSPDEIKAVATYIKNHIHEKKLVVVSNNKVIKKLYNTKPESKKLRPKKSKHNV